MSAAESLASPAPKANREAVAENHSARLMGLDVFRGLAVAGMILVDNPGSDEKASLYAVLFCWALLWLLWRKRIFLKL
jgi:predicted acyltransferase